MYRGFRSFMLIAALAGCAAQAALAADEPFQRRVNVVIPSGETFARAEFVASESKRLVIDHVSYAAHITPGSGQNAMVVISTTVGGQTLGHTAQAGVNIGGVIPSGQSAPSVERLIASHPMHVYSDPKTPVTVSVERHGPRTGAISTYVMISGHFE
ncbi:MAG TPA: hypothetical protein VJQ51_12160 [Burkholderiales bacterium]|nr:hypothetical protein [Burkholderiales bacterium]